MLQILFYFIFLRFLLSLQIEKLTPGAAEGARDRENLEGREPSV